MRKTALITVLLYFSFLAIPASAYFENYPPHQFKKGPFPHVKAEPLVDLDKPEYKSDNGKFIARLKEGAESLDFLVKDGNVVLAQMTKNETPLPHAVYRADLDKNGLEDIVVFYSYRGAGLAGFNDKVEIFLKKTATEYQRITFDTMSASLGDFVDIDKDGKYEVIITNMYGGAKHNYFTYSIYQFNDSKLTNADSKFEGFPKFVWITDKPNDKDTTHLTKEEKQKHIAEKNSSIQYESIPSSPTPEKGKKTPGINSALKEADTSFTFEGKPIHPGLVEEFQCWISDPSFPTTISVDVAADHGNEYFEGDVKVEEEGWVCKKGDQGESFCYKWLGKLQNGLHVLQIAESGGGSGVFGDLFFIKFDIGEGYTDEGIKYSRLLMSIVRSYGLGDRDEGEIKVLPDKVIVGKSQNRDKPVVVEFLGSF